MQASGGSNSHLYMDRPSMTIAQANPAVPSAFNAYTGESMSLYGSSDVCSICCCI